MSEALVKICSFCNKEKENKSFAKGKFDICNTCYKKNWNIKNPDKVRAHRLYGNATKRAKTMNWPKPDFDCNWIYDKIKNGYCEVTGIKFDLTTEVRSSVHAKNPWVPSIDRTDSSKPYLKDNVKIVIFMYNVCKSEFSHEDVVKFCKLINNKHAI